MRRSTHEDSALPATSPVAVAACVLLLSFSCPGCKPREQIAREEAQRTSAAVEPDVERFGSSEFESNKLMPKGEKKQKWSMPAGLGLDGFKEGLRNDMRNAKRPLKQHR